jgi:hypothetical protein
LSYFAAPLSMRDIELRTTPHIDASAQVASPLRGGGGDDSPADPWERHLDLEIALRSKAALNPSAAPDVTAPTAASRSN